MKNVAKLLVAVNIISGPKCFNASIVELEERNSGRISTRFVNVSMQALLNWKKDKRNQ